MKISTLVTTLGLCLLLAGCITPYKVPIKFKTNKTAEVMGINDDRQIITMGSAYGFVENPVVDWSQARADAAQMCRKRTGKNGAEPVGPTRRECVAYVGSDCVKHAILGDYRCVQLDEQSPAAARVTAD